MRATFVQPNEPGVVFAPGVTIEPGSAVKDEAGLVIGKVVSSEVIEDGTAMQIEVEVPDDSSAGRLLSANALRGVSLSTGHDPSLPSLY